MALHSTFDVDLIGIMWATEAVGDFPIGSESESK